MGASGRKGADKRADERTRASSRQADRGRVDGDGQVGRTSGRGWIVGGQANRRIGAGWRPDGRTGGLVDERTRADGGGRISEG